MDSNPMRPCAPRARCHDFRRCPICARIRQAQIADAAERLASKHPTLTWHCISPSAPGAAALAAARAAFLRATDPPGALWTVEISPSTGALHCNVIAPTGRPIQLQLARLWSAPIAGNPRDVAAYISKRDQMPSRDDYPGRLYGTSGPLWQWLATGKGHPIVEAAKTQYDLDASALATTTDRERRAYIAARPLTKDDYRAIAAARLPDIMRYASSATAKPAPTETRKANVLPPRRYYRPVLNSRRVRWLTGTLRPWERDWKPKSAR